MIPSGNNDEYHISKLRFFSEDPITSVAPQFIIDEDLFTVYDDTKQEVSRF